jgi:DNA-binding Lrp family transcriptional regulator
MPTTAPKDILQASDFLILQALERRPMTAPELARVIQISAPTVKKRLKRYEEHGVVRKYGTKWYPNLVLWVAPSADLAEGVSGQKVMVQTPNVPEILERVRVEQGEVVENTPSEAPEGPGTPPRVVPDPPPPGKEKRPYEPPRTRAKVSESASRLAKKMRIPPHLEGRGEVSMGRARKCITCNRVSPIRYGEETVCPMCARGGK